MGSEILESLGKLFRFLFAKAPASADDLAMQEHFRKKYKHFQELLESNAELLKIVSDMEIKLQGHQLFGMSYVRTQATRAVFHALRLAGSFESLSGKPNPNLRAKVEEISERIKAELESRKDTLDQERILEYSRVTREMVDAVGGKSANLGEVRNRVGLPVPRGEPDEWIGLQPLYCQPAPFGSIAVEPSSPARPPANGFLVLLPFPPD